MGRSYRDLIAWQKSLSFVTQIYASTQSFPQQERFGLTSQLRRAAVSIPSNIAEGQARSSPREFHHFPAMRGAHWQRSKPKFKSPGVSDI
ncbi:MAG: four helix bundle protein [Terriglobales bacterium]